MPAASVSMNTVSSVGMAIILALMALAIFNDLVKFVF